MPSMPDDEMGHSPFVPVGDNPWLGSELPGHRFPEEATDVSRRQLVADSVRVELGVAIWRLADAICARGQHRLHGSCWQELGCRIGSVGELVIGGRLMDAADRLRWADDYSSDYERHPW